MLWTFFSSMAICAGTLHCSYGRQTK